MMKFNLVKFNKILLWEYPRFFLTKQKHRLWPRSFKQSCGYVQYSFINHNKYEQNQSIYYAAERTTRNHCMSVIWLTGICIINYIRAFFLVKSAGFRFNDIISATLHLLCIEYPILLRINTCTFWVLKFKINCSFKRVKSF